jgi:HlyD family secretion protein
MKTHRIAPLAIAALSLLACGRKSRQVANIQTVPVTRQTIVIDAQAAGTVEPINVVEVKSKASGVITRMTVETGTAVKPGALLAQIDTRDVQNQYNQALADVRAAEARLEVSTAQKRRADEMFRARVITAQEHETSTLDYANAQAQVVRARASLDLAKQRLEDATVTAPVAGTIIEKTVSLGQVITSATGAFGGGTTLLKMADLSRVRVRALFNETDIGQVNPAQPATVVVDAYPDRRFAGMVEKIEPQAVVQQGVTMFPVLVTLDNREGLLKPGMNGEVSVLIDERVNVIAVPNDAVRNTREAVATAPLLGLDPDSVQA